MSIKSIFFGPEDKPEVAEEVEWNIKYLKAMPKGLTTDDLLKQTERLHNEVKKLKKEGISMWNASAQIPKVFDIVDGAFVIVTEVVKKLGEKE